MGVIPNSHHIQRAYMPYLSHNQSLLLARPFSITRSDILSIRRVALGLSIKPFACDQEALQGVPAVSPAH